MKKYNYKLHILTSILFFTAALVLSYLGLANHDKVVNKVGYISLFLLSSAGLCTFAGLLPILIMQLKKASLDKKKCTKISKSPASILSKSLIALSMIFYFCLSIYALNKGLYHHTLLYLIQTSFFTGLLCISILFIAAIKIIEKK